MSSLYEEKACGAFGVDLEKNLCYVSLYLSLDERCAPGTILDCQVREGTGFFQLFSHLIVQNKLLK